MALTGVRTAPREPGGTGTGMRAMEGSSTANTHQDCLAEGCDGGDPPWHNTQRPDVYLSCARAVPRAPEHLQRELGTSKVLHSCVRAIRFTAFTSKHPGALGWAATARISSLGLGGMQTPDCPQISSLLKCSWVDLNPLPLPTAFSSPPRVSPTVDSASSLMTLIIQLFSGHT